jgi:hypothetical protein
MAVGNLNSGVGIQPTIIDAKGDLLVGTADNVVNRLGVTGTTGSVLTADAGETTGLKWAAAGSVGGLVHIKTVSFSGAVSHSFGSNADPIFTSQFTNYKIILDDLLATSSNQDVNLRLRENTTDLTGSVYQMQNHGASGGNTYFSNRTSNGTSALTGVAGFTAGTKSSIIIEIQNPQTAKVTNFIASNSFPFNATAPIIQNTVGFIANTSQYNGFTIFAGTNISGTMSVYGYKI